MGLIECSDCGKKISDSAEKCRYCGNRNTPINLKKKEEAKKAMEIFNKIVLTSLVIFLFGVGIIPFLTLMFFGSIVALIEPVIGLVIVGSIFLIISVIVVISRKWKIKK